MTEVHKLYAHYHYTLTGEQQSAIQVYLRLLPRQFRTEAWNLLHELTYADNWSENESDSGETTPKTEYQPTTPQEIEALWRPQGVGVAQVSTPGEPTEGTPHS